MSIEDIIKTNTDNIVNQIREKCKENNVEFSRKDELIFRTGIANGITIACSSIVNAPLESIIIGDENET